MVHALEKAHNLLNPNGSLVDIQEYPHQRWLGISLDGAITRAGEIGAENDFEDVRLGHAAVNKVITSGPFKQIEELKFEAHTYAESIDDLVEYFSESTLSYKDILNNTKEMLARAGKDAQPIIVQAARMVHLKPQ